MKTILYNSICSTSVFNVGFKKRCKDTKIIVILIKKCLKVRFKWHPAAHKYLVKKTTFTNY